MKGCITVKRLNKNGNFVSELDYDKSFIDSSNKKGYFKMLIQPIENEIRYMKVKGGYKVSGEAYIISDKTEELIDNRIKSYREKYSNVLMTEVQSDDELW